MNSENAMNISAPEPAGPAAPAAGGANDAVAGGATGTAEIGATQAAVGEWSLAPFLSLARARIGLGLTVEQVAAGLAVRPAYVEAIERGRLEVLPGCGAARSMLARYAVLVGLDPEQIVRSAYVPSYFPQPTFAHSRRMSRQLGATPRRRSFNPVLLWTGVGFCLGGLFVIAAHVF